MTQAADQLQEFDVVALVQPLPEHELPVGQTGTIVYVHPGRSAFEVEFPLAPRKSVVVTVRAESLIKLHGLPHAAVG